MFNRPLLAQNDSNKEKREEEIGNGREVYKYKYNYPSLNGVAMADGVPHSELPHFEWTVRLGAVLGSLIKNLVEEELTHKKKEILLEWEIISDILKSTISHNDIDKLEKLLRLFKTDNSSKDVDSLDAYNDYFEEFDIPSIAKNFQEDEAFVARRVAGQNPVVIESITDATEHFPLSNEVFQSILGFEDDTLELAGAHQRLYMIDYKALKGIKNGKNKIGDKYSYAPKALFALVKDNQNTSKSLRPIAIICGQKSDDENPIFTPHDGYAWEIAKTIIEIADLNHHELVSHLAGTHLLIEPFVVTTHRQFADRHPLKVLLVPHFEGTIFINWGAEKHLVNDGGKFDELFSGTMDTNRAVVAKRLRQSFNHSMLPYELEQRGVKSKKLFYPYRDDASKIWIAIGEWVDSYLSLYYKSDSDVIEDIELQSWVTELISEGRVCGFGEDDKGKMTTFAYLKEVVTMLIFTSSAQHASVNFTQKEFAGYPPNMPAAGYTPAPKDKNKSKEDWFKLLPPVSKSDSQINLMQLLSDINYTTLGKYGWFYFWDWNIFMALLKFKLSLRKIEKEIKKRNREEELFIYEYLLPSRIPQSINV